MAEVLLAIFAFTTWIGSQEPRVSFASLCILVKELYGVNFGIIVSAR